MDATIADDTAYLSHVFGLRAAPSLPLKDTSRSISNTATDSSRSTSGNSLVYKRFKPKVQDLGLLKYKERDIRESRPIVERDPYQNIGIRKGPQAREIGKHNEMTFDDIEEVRGRVPLSLT